PHEENVAGSQRANAHGLKNCRDARDQERGKDHPGAKLRFGSRHTQHEERRQGDSGDDQRHHLESHHCSQRVRRIFVYGVVEPASLPLGRGFSYFIHKLRIPLYLVPSMEERIAAGKLVPCVKEVAVSCLGVADAAAHLKAGSEGRRFLWSHVSLAVELHWPQFTKL